MELEMGTGKDGREKEQEEVTMGEALRSEEDRLLKKKEVAAKMSCSGRTVESFT